MIMRKILSVFVFVFTCYFATAQDSLYLVKNYPNPFYGTTNVQLAVEEAGEVTLVVADVYGNSRSRCTLSMESGVHELRIALRAKGYYVLGAHKGGKRASLLMLCNAGGAAEGIEYLARIGDYPEVELEQMPLERIQNPLENPLEQEEEESEKVPEVNNKEGLEETVRKEMAKAGKQENEEQVPFRVALSLSPFSLNQFKEGYTFNVGDRTATTPAELQEIYRELGSTEMYVRLATKRHVTYNADGSLDNTTDGKPDENANVHTFDQVIETCKLAASLNIPINPEVMCAYTYMDMDNTQAPRFEEYPEIYALQKGKKWEELSLEEICTVLEAYGEFVGRSILATGCTVNDWNIGNEANFGFAGIGMGQPNSFDKKLAKAGTLRRYLSALFGVWWLKKHVWRYEAEALAAVKNGILTAYQKAGKDASNVKFSTHIATVVSTPRCSAAFFKYMDRHGYEMQTAGISYYPSAPAMSLNKKRLLKKTVTRINKKTGLPVFIGEFSYPSGDMEGAFAGWNKKLKGYDKDQDGQAEIYKDVIKWGKKHEVAGIRYWAPDYKGWYSMSMFEFDENNVGTAKKILTNHKELVK